MKVLVSESTDKKTRHYAEIPTPILLKAIEVDNGLHEVIDMSNENNTVRVFFDIDWKGSDEPSSVLKRVLHELNFYYGTTSDDWAITDGSHDEVVSFHIYSKKYYTTLKQLRLDAKCVDCKYIDRAVYYFSIDYGKDEGSLRLPNQSKTSINKNGGIHRLITGTLSDCLLSQTTGLISWPKI